MNGGIRQDPRVSVRRIGGKPPAGPPELGSNHRVATEGAPRARERFGDADSHAGMRHERQGERLFTWTLIDAARDSLESALKDPAKEAYFVAVSRRSHP